MEKKMAIYTNNEENIKNNINQFFDHAVSIIVVGFNPTSTIESKDGMVWVIKDPTVYSVEIDGIKKSIDKSLLSWLIENYPEKVSTNLYGGSLSTTLSPTGFEVPVFSNCR